MAATDSSSSAERDSEMTTPTESTPTPMTLDWARRRSHARDVVGLAQSYGWAIPRDYLEASAVVEAAGKIRDEAPPDPHAPRAPKTWRLGSASKPKPGWYAVNVPR